MFRGTRPEECWGEDRVLSSLSLIEASRFPLTLKKTHVHTDTRHTRINFPPVRKYQRKYQFNYYLKTPVVFRWRIITKSSVQELQITWGSYTEENYKSHIQGKVEISREIPLKRTPCGVSYILVRFLFSLLLFPQFSVTIWLLATFSVGVYRGRNKRAP